MPGPIPSILASARRLDECIKPDLYDAGVETRRVNQAGFISWQGNNCYVGESLIGAEVAVEQSPESGLLAVRYANVKLVIQSGVSHQLLTVGAGSSSRRPSSLTASMATGRVNWTAVARLLVDDFVTRGVSGTAHTRFTAQLELGASLTGQYPTAVNGSGRGRALASAVSGCWPLLRISCIAPAPGACYESACREQL
ncbi:hypothetical protein BH20VER1_BH20VER1_17440 [soil metagenome]